MQVGCIEEHFLAPKLQPLRMQPATVPLHTMRPSMSDASVEKISSNIMRYDHHYKISCVVQAVPGAALGGML